MKRLLILAALTALAACDREQPLEAPGARPGVVATGAPEDYAEPAAQAVRIEAELAEAEVREVQGPAGDRDWRLDGAVVKRVQPVAGGDRTAYFRDGRVFLIREPQAAYAFHDGRAIYAYDGEGRPREMTAAVRRAAEVALASVLIEQGPL